MKKYLFISVFLLLFIAIILNTFIYVNNKREANKYISIVKNYYNENYNNINYGKAFDKFFIMPQWEYIGKKIVKFSGGFMYNDNETIIKVYFEVHDKQEQKVKIKYVLFNEQLKDNLTQKALLSRVFESY